MSLFFIFQQDLLCSYLLSQSACWSLSLIFQHSPAWRDMANNPKISILYRFNLPPGSKHDIISDYQSYLHFAYRRNSVCNKEIISSEIITTTSNDSMKPNHDRIPIIPNQWNVSSGLIQIKVY